MNVTEAINNRGEDRAFILAASFCAASTVLSQFLPGLSALSGLTWIGVLLFAGVQNAKKICFAGYAQLTLIIGLLLAVMCSVCYLAFEEEGYVTGLLLVVLKALLVYYAGLFIGSCPKSDVFWQRLFDVFIAVSIVYCIWVWVNYFPGFTQWLSSQTYLFASKNSFGQIAGIAILLCVVRATQSSSKLMICLYALAAALLFFALLFCQCRSSLIALAAMFVSVFLMRRKARQLILLVAFAALLVVAIPEAQSVFAHVTLLDKYSDANSLSSNRFAVWIESLNGVIAEGCVLFGYGSYYCDNMYICAFANWGVIGFALLMTIWVSRVSANRRHFHINKMRSGSSSKILASVLYAMTFFYLIESVLEGYPPFGPGGCSFVFWLLAGYMDGQEQWLRGKRANYDEKKPDGYMMPEAEWR